MSEASARVKTVALVGSGYPLYLAAHWLAKAAPYGVERIYCVDLLEKNSEKLIASMGAMRDMHQSLGLSETALVKSAKAEINLGFRFSGFTANQDQIFCDAEYGFEQPGKRFYHLFNRIAQGRSAELFQDYCINAKMASLDRFTPPSQNAKSVFAGVRYGYRISATAYEEFLRSSLNDHKIQTLTCSQVLPGKMDKGLVQSIVVDDAEIAIDLIVELSARRPIQSKIAESHKRDFLNVDGISVTQTRREDTAKSPCTELVKKEGSLTLGGTYCGELFIREFEHGRDPANGNAMQCTAEQNPWHYNCVALGPAHCHREALLFDEAYWINQSLERLLELWPRTASMAAEAAAYNAKINAQFAALVALEKFVLLVVLGKQAQLSQDITHKLNTYALRGKVVTFENEPIDPSLWPVLFACLGIVPKHCDNSVLGDDSVQALENLTKFKALIAKAAAAAPHYADFIKPLHR